MKLSDTAICLQKIFFLNSVWCYILKREIENNHFFHVPKVIKLVSGIQTWHIYTSFQNLEKYLCSCRLLWFWCICATCSIHRKKIICVFPVVLFFFANVCIYIYRVSVPYLGQWQIGSLFVPNLGHFLFLTWGSLISTFQRALVGRESTAFPIKCIFVVFCLFSTFFQLFSKKKFFGPKIFFLQKVPIFQEK